ncbi:MAG: 4-hydroxy-tetrahydrodipicolinate synthase [Burkholderiales bacterium]|nr:4-hydroxy-tetrahydrodipicolinate synthase [Burkholderiales bacterium]
MPAHHHLFSGLWIALVTPFRDGTVDHPALHRLVEQLGRDGVSGFVPCGSTGEAAALDKTEQLAVLDTVLQACGGRPVVMGVSGYHLPQMLDWVHLLGQQPVAGLLVPAPLYIRPSQAGLRHWFEAIATASPLPLIVYDIPYRTGSRIEVDTLLALADHPNIQAVKDCGGDAHKTRTLIADGRLQVLAGEDTQMFSTVALGGAGAISAAAHVNTAAWVQVLQRLQAGDLPTAQRMWHALAPVIEALFNEPNPALIKAVLAHQGQMTPELRPPMMAATPEGTAAMLQLLDGTAAASRERATCAGDLSRR